MVLSSLHDLVDFGGSECHNGFPLDLDDHKKKNGVATDLFCMCVISHLGCMFLN